MLTGITKSYPFLHILGSACYFMFFFFNLFIYLATLGPSYGMWDLVRRPGIEPVPLVLGAWSLSPWTTRESFPLL